MKTVLVQCPMIPVDTPSLGLAYIYTYLKKKGKDVELLDINIEFYSSMDDSGKKFWEPDQTFLWYFEEEYYKMGIINKSLYSSYADEILAKNPDIIGFSINSTCSFFTRELVAEIKKRKKDAYIVFGGPSAYMIYSNGSQYNEMENHMEEYCDAIITGESEDTFLDIIDKLEKDQMPECPGATVKIGSEWRSFGKRKPIHNLDTLPFPDYSVFPLEKYRDKNMIRMTASRGCNVRCVFCTDTMIWDYHRYRTAWDIFMEMRLRKAQGYNFVEFNDSTLNGDLKILGELCDLIIESGIKVNWGGSAKVRPDMDLKFLAKMKNAGCERLTVGIETGSQRILDQMNKKLKISEVETFLKDSKEIGIQVFGNFIVGFPTETESDFMETVEFIKRNAKYMFECSVSTFFINPHSIIEKHPEIFDITYDKRRNWERSDGMNSYEERQSKFDKLKKVIEDNVSKLNYFSITRFRDVPENIVK